MSRSISCRCYFSIDDVLTLSWIVLETTRLTSCFLKHQQIFLPSIVIFYGITLHRKLTYAIFRRDFPQRFPIILVAVNLKLSFVFPMPFKEPCQLPGCSDQSWTGLVVSSLVFHKSSTGLRWVGSTTSHHKTQTTFTTYHTCVTCTAPYIMIPTGHLSIKTPANIYLDVSTE